MINAPTADKPYGKSYTVEMLGNVVGSRAVRYINVPMERLRKMDVPKCRQEKLFGLVQCCQLSNRKAESLRQMSMTLNQAWTFNSSRQGGCLDYSESLMTHAMVLTGVDLDENVNQSVELKLLGNKVGTDGYFVASDAWMDEYTYQIVVRKELLTAEEQAYEAEPIVLTIGSNGCLG